MGMEVESELAPVSVEAVIEEKGSLLHENENGKANQGPGINVPIKFGSHGLDEQVKGEVNNLPEDTNVPRDAVDEWPAEKQIHTFYLVKYRSYEDPKLIAKLEQADKDVQKMTQARSQLIEKLRAKRGDRAQVTGQMRSINEENKQFWDILNGKKKEMEPLHQALGKLRERGVGICSSEEELNDLIKSLQYRIQHESIPLTEEKQILRDIKQLEGTREKVIANVTSMGEKQSIQDQVKLMGVDMDGVRKDHQLVKVKRKQLEEEKKAIDEEISSIVEKLNVMTQKRDEGYKYLQEMKKQREQGNACYFQNRTLLNKAKNLAAKKDIETLKEMPATEVDNFMSQWNSSNAFRDDYVRRILQSLDFRQMSRDGRIRNPDEKPLVSATPSEKIESMAKTNVKNPKEDPITPPLTPPQHDSSTTQQIQKEVNGKVQKEGKTKATVPEPADLEERERVSVEVVEKLQKDPPPKVDEVKLREMRREEEMAKAKLAMERKKKLADKAAAKAALKAEKEAEKKLKDREKKAKKKAAASGAVPDSEELTDQAVPEAVEPEKAEDNVEASAPSKKNRDRKENTANRHRSRAKGPDSLAKVILKRKKSTNYWEWAAPAAAVSVPILIALGYNYLLH